MDQVYEPSKGTLRQNALTLAVVAAVTSVIILVGLWLLPAGSFLSRGPSQTIDYGLDPKLGSALPDELGVSVDALGRRVSEGKRDLLVYGGSCTECSLNAVQYSKLPVDEFDRIFVLYESRVRDVRSAVKSVPPKNVFLIAEPSGKLTGRLNAVVVGRWYSFLDAKLVRLQKDSGDVDWGVTR